MNLSDACNHFVTFCRSVRKLSDHTIRAYQFDLASFQQFAEERSADSCDRQIILGYVQHLFEARHLSESSVRRHVATLRSFFHWIEEQPEPDSCPDPFRTLRVRIKMPRRLPRVLPRSDIGRVLRVGAQRARLTFENLTTYVATEILFATGMRVGELARLRDRDVDAAEGIIVILGKGNRERRVFVPREVAALIRRYRTARAKRPTQSDTFLLSRSGTPISPDALRNSVRQLGEYADVDRRVTPHMFRHSIATYLLEDGVDIRYVQRLLGHRSISTTEIYTHVADASLRMRVTECHPRRTILGRVTG